MNRSRALYHMVRADFLERVRRYSFLLTLGFSVYLGYAVYAGQISLRVGNYRGVENSAWLGTVMGLVATVFITLTGFYVVKNSIQRDRQTRVGQILATTPISKSFYTLAKALSNFAVLAVMVLVLALGAVVIQLSHHEDLSIDFAALLAPVLVLGAFAGLRTAEIERLDWSEVNLGGKFIEMKAKKAKTRARRLGPIVPALEAGNSPDIIFQHYRELVAEVTAKEWFVVTPDLVDAEKKGLLAEGAKRKAEREKAKAEKTGGQKKRKGKKVGAGAAAPVPEETKIVAFPAKAAA